MHTPIDQPSEAIALPPENPLPHEPIGTTG